MDVSVECWSVIGVAADNCGSVDIDISVYTGVVDNCGMSSMKAMSCEPINKLLDITGAITNPVSRYKHLN